MEKSKTCHFCQNVFGLSFLLKANGLQEIFAAHLFQDKFWLVV